ncbi:hypothetical protein O181_083022 [Austropuccinia psidii MF-1]|uniref:Uncharacterized protein n=1 Tax=Austropuccinia psidii MF-1 TaxID=1389203 RepID=A0A9Q3FRL1_9BASI|nr:hypothetical protein [Austropuccinia psidii MF-1]
MEYINWTATKLTVCIDNSQHLLIIDSGAPCSIVARAYLDHKFPNWEKQLFPTKAKNFKSESGKMTSIGTIIKEIIIPHRKVNIRLNQSLLCLKIPTSKGFTHRGESRVNCRRLNSRQANFKQDKSQAHVKPKSSERRAHITLWSYTKSCDIQ